VITFPPQKTLKPLQHQAFKPYILPAPLTHILFPVHPKHFHLPTHATPQQLTKIFPPTPIIPHPFQYLTTSPFPTPFQNKPPFQPYLPPIPLYLLLSQFPPITGAAPALHNHFKNL
ncbi:glucokinase, partial [Neisseria sicca]|uniref:glucokinase n=1 Tax=Neisseria sicca TaxID=490 RepID=UPI001C9A1127